MGLKENMDWTTPLRSLQSDFIQRLKSGYLLHSELEGTHSELTVISGERLNQLRDFCWEMADKYKRNSHVHNVFMNNMKGKLGEEVIKARLGDFVTEVDYEKRIGGDGKVDFTLTDDPSVGIQVKARHGDIDTVRWSISQAEVEKNAVLVCVLIQEEVSEAQSEYHLILAGFLPTEMIEVRYGKPSFRIDDLLYGGGTKSYLENCIDFVPLAERFYQKGDYQKAMKYCENILQCESNNATAYLILGIAYYHNEDYQKALDDLRNVIQFDPENILAYAYYGMALRDLGYEQYAMINWEKAISIEPKCANDSKGRGIAYCYLKEYKMAIGNLTKSIDLDSRYIDAYYWLGVTRSESGDWQGAIEEHNKVIKINPSFPNAYFELGNVLLDQKDFYAAVNAYQEAAELYKQQGNYELSEKALEWIREINRYYS